MALCYLDENPQGHPCESLSSLQGYMLLAEHSLLDFGRLLPAPYGLDLNVF